MWTASWSRMLREPATSCYNTALMWDPEALTETDIHAEGSGCTREGTLERTVLVPEKDLFISRFQVRTDDLPFKASVRGNRIHAAPLMKQL